MVTKQARGAIVYSNSIAAQQQPRLSDPLFACPICGRSRLRGENALWTHIRMRHDLRNLNKFLDGEPPMDARPPDMHEACEAALIRIANATTLDDAVAIALAALLGEEARALADTSEEKR